MEKLKTYLEAHKLITDGAFGTYYSRVYDTNELPESVNITMGRRVTDIHKEYINAGAKLIRTNTFAANTVNLECNFDEVKANIKQLLPMQDRQLRNVAGKYILPQI